MSRAWSGSRSGPDWFRPKPNVGVHHLGRKVFPNGNDSLACKLCSVEILSSLVRRSLGNSHELLLQSLHREETASIWHAFAADRPLSLIVCGVRR